MKSIAAIAALIASAAAQGYSTAAPGYFGVISTRSASPIHFQVLTARGGKFYLGGGPPSSYCPVQVGDACPSGNETTLAGGVGTLSLGVVVPGGQQVYVDPDASLSYTVPHSAYIPEGSVRDGWSRVEGEQFGTLTFKSGLIACPTNKTEVGWQVFGQIAGKTFDPSCLGFNALTINATEAGAWEY